MSKKHQDHSQQHSKKVVRLDQIKQKINYLKEEGQKQYKPKIGRKIAQLEKEYRKVA